MSTQFDKDYFDKQTKRMSDLALKAKAEGKSFMDVMIEENSKQVKEDTEKYCNPWNYLHQTIEEPKGFWEGLRCQKTIQDKVIEDIQNKYKALCEANPNKKYKLEWSDNRIQPIENNTCSSAITVKIVEA